MNIRSISLGIIMSLSCVAASSQALAYSYKTCGDNIVDWESNQVSFVPSTVSFSTESTILAVFEAAAGWTTDAPASLLELDLFFLPDTTWTAGDDVNSIAYTYDYDWGSSTLAVTVLRSESCGTWGDGDLVETDILFNPAFTWSFSTSPEPASTSISFLLVATHELGHAIGLGHEDRWLATMNSSYPNGGVIGHYNQPQPHSDDLLGMRYLVGWPTYEHDVAASFYKYGGSYATLISAPSKATHGSTAKFGFTISNRGSYSESSIPVKFYLSKNRTITTSDYLLGGVLATMPSGSETTFSLTTTIPSSIPQGAYYFGYLLDPDAKLTEADEYNNGAAMQTSTYIEHLYIPTLAATRSEGHEGDAPLFGQ